VTSDWDRFRTLGITSWHTWDEGPDRDRRMPYSTVGDHGGHPVPIRFGAFLVWTQPVGFWNELAPTLAPGVLQRAGLIYILHQAGGHACLQLGYVGRPVELAEPALEWATTLCRDHYHAEQGWFSEGTPGNIAAYRERARSLGLTADLLDDLAAGYDLVESLYPLDASDRNLEILLRGGIPTALVPLLENREIRRRMIFVLLADNSD
jgi:hypothetical protein